MPIAPGPITQPPVPVAPNVVPPGQRLLPVEPARRVTANRESGRAGLDAERRRRRQPDRGGAVDLEV